MTMKYAEITIIRNIEQEDILRTFARYFGYENTTNDTDTIIITFDDGSICDTKDEYTDKKYKFGMIGHNHYFPIHFQKDEKNICIFYRETYIKDGVKFLNFKNVFKYNKNYEISRDSSAYNLIYENINKKEVFAICRIKSSEENPRFLLAYDDTIFDKSDIIYVVDYIFKSK